MNCNECENINITEIEQHKTSVLTSHMCLEYNCRVFHDNNHRGLDNYIEPCEQCRKEMIVRGKRAEINPIDDACDIEFKI